MLLVLDDPKQWPPWRLLIKFLEDHPISSKSIAEQLDISRERVGSIIHEDLDMRKPFLKWDPKYLTADQKRQRCQSPEQLLKFSRRDPNDFLSRLVTMDETMTRRQSSNQWSGGIAAHPTYSKKFRVQKSAGKILSSIFWDQDSILLIDYLPKGQTINAGYYLSLLVQLKDILKQKRRGKVSKVVLFLHDNVPAHRALTTQRKLAYLGFECLDHTPYSPDLVPSNYRLFPWLKKQLNVAIFRPTRRSLLPRRPGWTDRLLNFFEWLAKVRATD